jgi:formylglycine-generating enzyme required for sulfatase activity
MVSGLKVRVGSFIFLGLLLICGIPRPRADAGQQSKQALTRTEVLELLDAGVPPKRVEILARERGVGFELTAEIEKALRRAGATPSLIETLRELASQPSGPAILMVESRPGGAQVFVDDELMARTSSEGRLKISTLHPGAHRVRVSLEGFPDFEQAVELQEGKAITVVATLDTPKSSPPVLQIESRPGGAAVYVDDEFLARTSSEGRLKAAGIPPGRHHLRLSAPNYSDFEQNIDLVAGKTQTVSATLVLSGQRAGAVKENPRDGQTYVWIPPGSFVMGCSTGDTTCFDNEKPSHTVTLTRGFWLGKTEVTVAAYKRFASVTGKAMPGEPVIAGRNHNSGWTLGTAPMVAVAWEEAAAFCTWAGGRLPTEAEWEYSARAGSPNARYDLLEEIAWFGDNSGRTPIDSARIGQEDSANYDARLAANGNTNHPVGQKRSNAFGLFDMLGSVWEWVSDWYGETYYASSPDRDPAGPAGGELHAERGGSWQSIPAAVRTSRRAGLKPAVRWTDVGMRCALDSAP